MTVFEAFGKVNEPRKVSCTNWSSGIRWLRQTQWLSVTEKRAAKVAALNQQLSEQRRIQAQMAAESEDMLAEFQRQLAKYKAAVSLQARFDRCTSRLTFTMRGYQIASSVSVCIFASSIISMNFAECPL